MELNSYFEALDLKFKANDIEGAERLCGEWLEKANQQQDMGGVLAVSNELGGIYRVTSRFEEAKSAYGIALQAITFLKLTDSHQHGTTLLNMASVYAAAGNSIEALKLYEQAAGIFERAGLGNDYRQAALYNNISHVYDSLGDLNQAEVYAEKSLKIVECMPEYPIESGTTYTSLAAIYIRQNRYQEAERNLFTAEQLFQKHGVTNPHYAATLSAFGELYYHMKEYIKSIRYFEHSLKLIEATYGKNLSYASVCRNLSQVLEQIGRTTDAAEYRRLADETEERIRKI